MEPAPINDQKKVLLVTDDGNGTSYPNLGEIENINERPVMYNSINIVQEVPISQGQAPNMNNKVMASVSYDSPLLIPICNPQMQNQCLHFNLYLNIEKDHCQTCVCYSCCILGIVMLIAAVCLKLKESGGCSGSSLHGSNSTTIVFWNTHWLRYYGYDRNFVESRMGCHRTYNDMDSGCCGLKYPHHYKVMCHDCGHLLKEGHKYGGLVPAVILGLVCIATSIALILTI